MLIIYDMGGKLLNGIKSIYKVLSNGSAMWKEHKMTGLLRESVYGSLQVVAQWVGHGRGGLIL